MDAMGTLHPFFFPLTVADSSQQVKSATAAKGSLGSIVKNDQ